MLRRQIQGFSKSTQSYSRLEEIRTRYNPWNRYSSTIATSPQSLGQKFLLLQGLLPALVGRHRNPTTASAIESRRRTTATALQGRAARVSEEKLVCGEGWSRYGGLNEERHEIFNWME
ncbi:hypothetical protein Dimus_003665 [Dionaea muscipula]